MPIISAEIQYRLSGGAGNTDPLASLGGVKATQTVTAGTLFDTVNSTESNAGDVEYRCIYVHNANGSLSLQNAVMFIPTNTSGNRIDIGVGTSAVNGTEQTVGSENTAPSGVSFSQPSTAGTGISLGTIPAGQHRAVWVRRTIAAATAASNDSFTLRVQGDTAA